MTRLDKSDSQLDAEATALEHGLRWYIVDLRRELMRESPTRVHQRQTSTGAGDELDEKGWPKDADEGGVGMPFSAAFHRFLRTNAGRSEKHRWDLGPDPRVRPAMASIQNESERCHSIHTSHLRPGYTRSLCAEMLFQVGYLGQEPSDIAWHFDLPVDQVNDMLIKALRHAYMWRKDTEQRITREPGTEAPMPECRPYKPAA